MVKCQSANQLKTPAKVSWAFKMVSQFGSLGYTITGKTADLTVVQKTIIDTLHKEGKPQTFIAKEAGCSQSAVSKHVNRKLSGRKESIHPSIFFRLSGAGSRGQQSKQRYPDFPLPRHFLQLFRGDTEAFPGQPGDIVSPACPRSSPGPPPGGKEGKSVEEKDAQPTERTTALWGLSSKIDSRIWVNFTRNGLRLGSHREPPHTDVSVNLATVVVRSVLSGLRRRRTGLLSSDPKSSFQMRAMFCISFGNQGPRSTGGRVEKLIAQDCLKSSVKFPQSVMIWGAMSSAGVDPLCFLITNVTAPVYQEILEHFMLPSADQLFKDADFIFQEPKT